MIGFLRLYDYFIPGSEISSRGVGLLSASLTFAGTAIVDLLVYQRATVTDDLPMSRRQILQTTGMGATVALAGCAGSGGGSGDENSGSTESTPEDGSIGEDSDSDQDSTTQKDTTSSPDSEPTESDQVEEGYPTQSSNDVKRALNEDAENREDLYAFEIHGMEQLNVEQIENAGGKYREGVERLSLEEALYVCATDAGLTDEPSEAYFLVGDPELAETLPPVSMRSVDENGNIVRTDGATIVGYADEIISEGTEYNVDTARTQLEDFLRKRIDGDSVGAGGRIDHAVDLEDFPYAVEALQSGYDAN